jgi:hypothetical protein
MSPISNAASRSIARLGLSLKRRSAELGRVDGANLPIFLLGNRPPPRAGRHPISAASRAIGRRCISISSFPDLEAPWRDDRVGRDPRPRQQREYGRMANLADPFGNGFDLIEFFGSGYDGVSR